MKAGLIRALDMYLGLYEPPYGSHIESNRKQAGTKPNTIYSVKRNHIVECVDTIVLV